MRRLDCIAVINESMLAALAWRVTSRSPASPYCDLKYSFFTDNKTLGIILFQSAVRHVLSDNLRGFGLVSLLQVGRGGGWRGGCWGLGRIRQRRVGQRERQTSPVKSPQSAGTNIAYYLWWRSRGTDQCKQCHVNLWIGPIEGWYKGGGHCIKNVLSGLGNWGCEELSSILWMKIIYHWA